MGREAGGRELRPGILPSVDMHWRGVALHQQAAGTRNLEQKVAAAGASLLTLSTRGGFHGAREEGLGAGEPHRRLQRGCGSTERGYPRAGPTPAPPPLIPLSPDSASAGWAGGPLGTAVT